MATTIGRATLTDGVTVWNAATVGSAIYDKVDALVAGAVTVGGVLGSEGFGTHSFSAGGTGANILAVRNTSSGNTNYCELRVGANTSATTCRLTVYSSTYATTADAVADGTSLIGAGAGGLSVCASHSGGEVRFYSGGTTQVAKFGATDGCLQLAKGLWFTGSFDQEVTGTQALTSTGQYTTVIRITSATSTPKISSFTAGNDGDVKILVNASGAACTVQHNGGGAGTRVYCSNATDATIADKESCMFIYDQGSAAWYQVGPQ